MTTATDVRVVEAGREHIPFVAWVVMTANRSHLPKGMWDLNLGTCEDEVLRYLALLADTETIHWGHYSLFLVAEVDGTPAAGMCGFFENEYPAASLMAGAAEVNAKMERSPEEIAAGWERAKSIMGIVMPHEPGAWVVEHVGTRPEYRRRGLVERLVHATLERGERGAPRQRTLGCCWGTIRRSGRMRSAGLRWWTRCGTRSLRRRTGLLGRGCCGAGSQRILIADKRMPGAVVDVDLAAGILARTPATLNALLGGLAGEGGAGGGDEEDWGPFDVVGHLIFGEETDWIPRARIIVEHGDSRPFVPFDRFTQFVKFEGRSMDDLLGMFEEARGANLETLRGMGITPEQLELRGMHPELGPVTLGQLLATWVVHDLGPRGAGGGGDGAAV